MTEFVRLCEKLRSESRRTLHWKTGFHYIHELTAYSYVDYKNVTYGESVQRR